MYVCMYYRCTCIDGKCFVYKMFIIYCSSSKLRSLHKIPVSVSEFYIIHSLECHNLLQNIREESYPSLTRSALFSAVCLFMQYHYIISEGRNI